MQGRFAPDEWDTLKALPFHVFGAIAIADRQIQQEEILEHFRRLVEGRESYDDPLHREIAQSIFDTDIEELRRKGPAAIQCDPQEAKRILQDKLTPEEYLSFVTSLLIDAVNVARASTTGRWIFKKEIDENERRMLEGMAGFWGVDLEPLVQD